MKYHGKAYSSFKKLWSDIADSSATIESTASTRLRTRLTMEPVSDDLLDDCLLLEASAYRAKYGARRTIIKTKNGMRDARDLYDAQKGPIDYSTFRTRLKSLESRGRAIDYGAIRDAATLNFRNWRAKHGERSGRAFVYEGEEYSDATGEYPSFHSFLKTIGRYEDRNTLSQRRKRYWDIDDLLREPIAQEGMLGYIYQITNTVTGMRYVGLSVNRPQVRFNQHLATAQNGGGSLLHEAIRADEARNFKVDTIEEVEDGTDSLAEREIFYIAKFGTLRPRGYNVLEGGQLGRYDGTPVTFEGRDFRSISDMSRRIGKETGLPEYVVLRCWREDRPFPDKARTHSNHAEAGSELFRQWLGMWKRAEMNGSEVAEEWEDYDVWKADTTSLDGDGRLTRIDEMRPWGPDNMTFMAHSDIIRRTHGKCIEAFGRVWEVKQDALKEFAIERNTFDFRIKAGWSVEDALATPLGRTSKTPITFEDEDFPSTNNAARDLSNRYGMTFNQTRDYLRRGVSSAEWPKNGQHVRSGPGIRIIYVVDDVTYASEKELCRAYKISPGAFAKRLAKGMTVEEAVKTPIKDMTASIFGYDWSSAKAACRAFDLSYSTYRARTKKHGMTPEEAILTPSGKGYTGYLLQEALNICKEHGLSESAPKASIEP